VVAEEARLNAKAELIKRETDDKEMQQKMREEMRAQQAIPR